VTLKGQGRDPNILKSDGDSIRVLRTSCWL